MKRLVALATVAAFAFAGMIAATAAQTTTPSKSTRPDPCAHHRHPAAEQRQLARNVFAYRNWRSPRPGPGALTTMRRLRGCVDAKTRAKMATAWHHAKADLRLQRRYRLVSPEEGFHGEGRFLRYLPVPRYIIECETNGYYGESRWHAANPSGAVGPAQLLGWGAPHPAETPAQRVEYWELTAYVLAVQGLSAWACA